MPKDREQKNGALAAARKTKKKKKSKNERERARERKRTPKQKQTHHQTLDEKNSPGPSCPLRCAAPSPAAATPGSAAACASRGSGPETRCARRGSRAAARRRAGRRGRSGSTRPGARRRGRRPGRSGGPVCRRLGCESFGLFFFCVRARASKPEGKKKEGARALARERETKTPDTPKTPTCAPNAPCSGASAGVVCIWNSRKNLRAALKMPLYTSLSCSASG